jgi:hypothetical protein
MLNKCKIINITSSDVVIEDLSLRLPGKGSFGIVDANAADRSKNLQDCKKLVRIERFGSSKPMPLWPFVKPPPPPRKKVKTRTKTITKTMGKSDEHKSIQDLSGVREDLQDIKRLLSELLIRPGTIGAPESVGVDPETTIPSMKDPMFIPSNIVPNDAEAQMSANEDEIQRDDFDDSLSALKKALKNKNN